MAIATEKQLLALDGIMEGLTEKEIARSYAMAVDTVKTHKRALFEKVGAKNSAHLVALAVRKGLVNFMFFAIVTHELGIDPDLMRNRVPKTASVRLPRQEMQV